MINIIIKCKLDALQMMPSFVICKVVEYFVSCKHERLLRYCVPLLCIYPVWKFPIQNRLIQ